MFVVPGFSRYGMHRVVLVMRKKAKRIFVMMKCHSFSLKYFLAVSSLSSNGWFPIPGASNTCNRRQIE